MEVRALIVAENVSARFGGESFLPLHYFRVLRARGVECHLLTHARVRDEVVELFGDDAERLHFVADSRAQVLLWKAGMRLPSRLNDMTLGIVSHLLSQARQRGAAQRLIAEHGLTIVHQPTPVSPRVPSAMFGLGAPVLIGPMNGGMAFPPGFRHLESSAERRLFGVLRRASRLANALIPGKRRAAALLVANDRTRQALLKSVRGVPVHEIVENGVDLERFTGRGPRPEDPARVRFAFVGRLLALKAVDLLFLALASMPVGVGVDLEVFGDGPERGNLEALAAQLGLADRVTFHGFVDQSEVAERLAGLDGLVLPSVHECGGAVVLEAMALGLPVIATRWGGPVDYLDDASGILIEPTAPASMVRDLGRAMVELAEDPSRRHALGRAGREKVEQEFDWERKIDQMLDLYATYGAPSTPPMTLGPCG